MTVCNTEGKALEAHHSSEEAGASSSPWRGAHVYHVGRDRLIVTGEPTEAVDIEGNSLHNCDYMGCGQAHVIARTLILRSDSDDPDWNRSRSMLDILASIHDLEVHGHGVKAIALGLELDRHNEAQIAELKAEVALLEVEDDRKSARIAELEAENDRPSVLGGVVAKVAIEVE